MSTLHYEEKETIKYIKQWCATGFYSWTIFIFIVYVSIKLNFSKCKNFYHLYADDTKLLYILHSKWVLFVLFTSTLLRQGESLFGQYISASYH